MREIVTFVAGVVFGGLLSWFITHLYYLKASADQRTELKNLSDDLKPCNTLRDFENLFETSSWTDSVIGDTELWIADTDNTFQIEKGERTHEYQECWTSVYPDQNSSAYPVYLKINGTIIRELTFISMDGGRIFVPMPCIRPGGADTIEYFWDLNSLEAKVCRVIGSFYRYNGLEGIAKISGITVIK